MVQSLEHKGDRVTEIAHELSPRVWGNIPLRSCIGLHGGNGRLANPLQIPTGAVGVADIGGGDIIVGSSGATTAIKSLDGCQALTMADNGSLTLGFSNSNCDFTKRRRWAFEVRLSCATATEHNIFAGLASASEAGSSIYTAGNVQTVNVLDTNGSFVGFKKDETSAVIATMAKNDAAALVENDYTTAGKTLTGGTLVKLGMHSDGRVIRFFVDNVQVGGDLDLDDANLPIEADLKPVIDVYSSATTANGCQVGFLAFAEAR